MGSPAQRDLDAAYKLVTEVCGFAPGSLAAFFGDLTGKRQSCDPKLQSDMFLTMAQIWLLAANQYPITLNLVARWKAHQANEWYKAKAAGVFASRGADATFDDFAKGFPLPTAARNVDDAYALASRAAQYMENAAIARGIANKLDRNFFQEIAAGFKSLPEMARLVVGMIECIDAGKCNSIGAAYHDLVAKRWATSADKGLEAKASAIQSEAETQRALNAAKMASAGAESSITTFIKSPLGMVMIGGVALIAALVLSEALGD
jgi:hypothetical protein